MGICEARCPRRHDRAHTFTVMCVPHDRVPVGVEHEEAAATAEDPMCFGERAIDVVDVLEDLRGDDRVERCVSERQRGGTAVAEGQELGLGRLRAVSLGDGQHVWAHVNTRDVPIGRQVGSELKRQEPRSGPDVEHALTRAWRQRLDRDPALFDYFWRAVDRFQSLGDAFVEDVFGAHVAFGWSSFARYSEYSSVSNATALSVAGRTLTTASSGWSSSP
jgi:hypothetical protein